MNRYNWFVILAPFAFALNAPAQVVLEGRVIDVENNTRVSFANISISNTSIGTASDENGEFQLKLAPSASEEKIVVSSIGYHNAFIAIDSILKVSNKQITISLRPFTHYLGEVVVSEKLLRPDELLREAIAAIPENYSQEPFNLEFYSRILVKDTSAVVYDLETILLMYRKGYVGKAANWSKILQKREHGNSPLPPDRDKKTKKEYFPFIPGFDIFLADRIGAGSEGGYTVFNPKMFDKMNFHYGGVSVFDQDTVARIEYSRRKKDIQKEPGEDGKYAGIIYIATSTLAIVRHTFGFGNIKLDVIYKRSGASYFPYSIRTERVVYAGDKAYEVVHTASLRNVLQEEIQVIEQTQENWHAEGVPFREQYWQSNYPKTR
jgi:hypothetical protein